MEVFFKLATHMAQYIENEKIMEVIGTYEDCAVQSVRSSIRLVKRLSDGLVVIRSGNIQEIDKLLNKSS